MCCHVIMFVFSLERYGGQGGGGLQGDAEEGLPLRRPPAVVCLLVVKHLHVLYLRSSTDWTVQCAAQQ